jgi:hypothetical protein
VSQGVSVSVDAVAEVDVGLGVDVGPGVVKLAALLLHVGGAVGDGVAGATVGVATIARAQAATARSRHAAASGAAPRLTTLAPSRECAATQQLPPR